MKMIKELLRNSPKLKRFSTGNDHNVFLVPAGKEKFVLKQYRFRTTESVKKEAEFINFLFQKKCKVPELIPEHNNRLSFSWKKEPSILMNYLPGSLLIDKKITDNLLCEIGIELGRIDKNSELFSKKFSFNPNANKVVNNILQPHPLFSNSSFSKFLKLFSGIKAITTILIREYEKNIKTIKGLPSSIIHNDVSEKNIIIANNRLSGLIDFSDFIKAPRVYNIATASAHLCFRDNHWKKNIKIFINSYRKSFKYHLDKKNIELLPFLMRYRILSEMATNFYLGSITKRVRNTEFTNHILWNKLKSITAIPENSVYEVIRGCC